MTNRSPQQKISGAVRVNERIPFPDEVTVTLESTVLHGSGKNMSETGVFFIADEILRVRVEIDGETITGDLVRVESHGHGRTGIAVRFDEGAFQRTRQTDETESEPVVPTGRADA